MSRTPGASCLLDVRTTAVIQEYVASTNPCAPGAVTRGFLGNCQPPVCGFDRAKDMVSVLGAMIIVATVIGTIHTASIFIPAAAIEYEAGYIELCLINAMTYLLVLVTACLTYGIIDYSGHKLTALFGMIFIFIGILLDSQVFHISILYISNIVLIGIGGGLAYAASVTLPSDLFRCKILTGTMIVNTAGSIGTIFYTWLTIEVIEILGFKWTKILMALLVLFFTLAVHVFPKTRLMYSTCDTNTVQGGHGKSSNIKDCVTQAARGSVKDDACAASEQSFLCVCICDFRLFKDRSFILWSSLVMLAAMTFHIPYLYIVSYAESVGARISAWYITIYCLASILTRCIFISNPDFTFAFNRAVFQGCIFISGAMWIVINWATTFGWILVICGVLGAIEGTLCIVTSRVAIGTIPWDWIGSAWISCIVFQALGMFAATVFTSVIALKTYHFYVAFMSVGVIQIIVAFLATLLPNEEDESATGVVGKIMSSMRDKCNANTMGQGMGMGMNIELMKRAYANKGAAGAGVVRAGAGAAGTATIERHYKCDCPICRQVGCMPECLPECSPAGTLNGQC